MSICKAASLLRLKNANQCLCALKLLLSGEVETNPGPESDCEDLKHQVMPLAVDSDAILTILRELKEKSSKIKQAQAHIIDAVKAYNKSKKVKATVTTISTRFEAVESKLTMLDSCSAELSRVILATQKLTEKNLMLKNRLDELEDSSTSENLVFLVFLTRTTNLGNNQKKKSSNYLVTRCH